MYRLFLPYRNFSLDKIKIFQYYVLHTVYKSRREEPGPGLDSLSFYPSENAITVSRTSTAIARPCAFGARDRSANPCSRSVVYRSTHL